MQVKNATEPPKAGAILLILLVKNSFRSLRARLESFWEIALINCGNIKKPETKKNRSTPKYPLGNTLGNA